MMKDRIDSARQSLHADPPVWLNGGALIQKDTGIDPHLVSCGDAVVGAVAADLHVGG